MKFKAGDLVVCTHNWGGQFTKGKVYKVISVCMGYQHERIMVERDDQGNTGNGWAAKFFELAGVPW